MPVEISIAQVVSLGVLLASVIFLLLLLGAGLYIARKVVGLASRFQSVGAERVNGRIQMRGLFHEQLGRTEMALPSKLGDLKTIMKEAANFDPTPEDLQRVAAIEQNAAGTGGGVN